MHNLADKPCRPYMARLAVFCKGPVGRREDLDTHLAEAVCIEDRHKVISREE